MTDDDLFENMLYVIKESSLFTINRAINRQCCWCIPGVGVDFCFRHPKQIRWYSSAGKFTLEELIGMENLPTEIRDFFIFNLDLFTSGDKE